jgi:hypothetical protein
VKKTTTAFFRTQGRRSIDLVALELLQGHHLPATEAAYDLWDLDALAAEYRRGESALYCDFLWEAAQAKDRADAGAPTQPGAADSANGPPGTMPPPPQSAGPHPAPAFRRRDDLVDGDRP